MKWLLTAIIVLIAGQCWGAAFTSKAAGNWSASGQTTWNEVGVPGDGDSVTIATGHTITIDSAVTIGAGGASGTTAIALNGTGVLNVNAPLVLKGDFTIQRGSTVNGNAGGSITFTPPSGATYKWITNNTGTSNATVNLTGASPASRFVVTTTQGGGGNAWIDDVSAARCARWNLTNVSFSYMGDNTNPAIKQSALSDFAPNNNSIVLINVSFNYCGKPHFQNSATFGTTLDYILTNVDIRNSLSSDEVIRLLVNTNKSSGTRSITNLTIYNGEATARSAYIAIIDLTASGIITHNVSFSALNAIRTSISGMFSTIDVNSFTLATVTGKNTLTLSDSIFLARSTNPHYFQEPSSTVGSGSANVYQNNVFDGDNYFNSDAGDILILQSATGSKVVKNISINRAGTLVSTMGSAVAVACELTGNTMHGSYGAAIGETTGGAQHIAKFNNNLTVAQSDGIHKQTSFVPQSAFTLNNNAYYGLTDVDFNWTFGNYGYMASRNSNRVGNTTMQAGTDSTHVVATGTPFTAVISGDFVVSNTKGDARVLTVTDSSHLVLDRPITGLTTGDIITVSYNWWNTAGQQWGDGTRGLGDVNVNPQFIDATRTVRGYGAWASVQAAAREMVTINGIAYDGSATTATTKTTAAALAYIREGFTPQNIDLLTAGEGGTYIGAVQPAAATVPNRGGSAFKAFNLGFSF